MLQEDFMGTDLLHRPLTDAPQLPGYAFYGSFVSAMSSSIVRLSASERPIAGIGFSMLQGIRGEAHGRLAVHRPVREQQRAGPGIEECLSHTQDPITACGRPVTARWHSRHVQSDG